jgi:hypothetical protein
MQNDIVDQITQRLEACSDLDLLDLILKLLLESGY